MNYITSNILNLRYNEILSLTEIYIDTFFMKIS